MQQRRTRAVQLKHEAGQHPRQLAGTAGAQRRRRLSHPMAQEAVARPPACRSCRRVRGRAVIQQVLEQPSDGTARRCGAGGAEPEGTGHLMEEFLRPHRARAALQLRIPRARSGKGVNQAVEVNQKREVQVGRLHRHDVRLQQHGALGLRQVKGGGRTSGATGM
jgi:hypothetical protein